MAVQTSARKVQLSVTVNPELKVLAEELAKFAFNKGINDNYIIPTMDDMQVFIDVAVAVGQKAIDQNVDRIRLSASEAREIATQLITDSQNQTKLLMQKGFIPEYPDYL